MTYSRHFKRWYSAYKIQYFPILKSRSVARYGEFREVLLLATRIGYRQSIGGDVLSMLSMGEISNIGGGNCIRRYHDCCAQDTERRSRRGRASEPFETCFAKTWDLCIDISFLSEFTISAHDQSVPYVEILTIAFCWPKTRPKTAATCSALCKLTWRVSSMPKYPKCRIDLDADSEKA